MAGGGGGEPGLLQTRNQATRNQAAHCRDQAWVGGLPVWEAGRGTPSHTRRGLPGCKQTGQHPHGQRVNGQGSLDRAGVPTPRGAWAFSCKVKVLLQLASLVVRH